MKAVIKSKFTYVAAVVLLLGGGLALAGWLRARQGTQATSARVVKPKLAGLESMNKPASFVGAQATLAKVTCGIPELKSPRDWGASVPSSIPAPEGRHWCVGAIGVVNETSSRTKSHWIFGDMTGSDGVVRGADVDASLYSAPMVYLYPTRNIPEMDPHAKVETSLAWALPFNVKPVAVGLYADGLPERLDIEVKPDEISWVGVK